MRKLTLVVSMLAALCSPAMAKYISPKGDPGGLVEAYVHDYQAMAKTDEPFVVDGPCLSACTLALGILSHSQMCATSRAVFGFHAATYFDDVTRTYVPTTRGTQIVMSYYPQRVRNWIERRGGMRIDLMYARRDDIGVAHCR